MRKTSIEETSLRKATISSLSNFDKAISKKSSNLVQKPRKKTNTSHIISHKGESSRIE